MATFVPVHELAEYLGTAQIHNDSHTFKAVLTNTAPAQATDATLAGLTQISAGATNYAPVTITGNAWTETGAGTGIWEFDCSPFSWTADADYATARYIYIYDDTPTSPVADPVVGYLDYGSTFVVTAGNTLTVTPGASGVWRLTVS
jgi:hypothetical protein